MSFAKCILDLILWSRSQCCYLFISNVSILPPPPTNLKQLDLGRCKLDALSKSNLTVIPATLVSQLAQPGDSDDMEIDSDKTPTSLTLPAYRNRALTSKQERKLVAFLDDLFLQLTRNYKKRSVCIYFILIFAIRYLTISIQSFLQF
jgi:hypothetical protein